MRVRWFSLFTRLTLRDVAARLKDSPYKDGAPDGFVVEQLRSDVLEASLIQRLQTTHEAIDPFGFKEQFDVIEYVRTQFRLDATRNVIELRDPGRSSSKLVSRLLEVLGANFTIEEETVNPLVWANKFREVVDLYGSIEKVQIGSVALGENTVAQVVVKGSSDVADSAIKFVAPSEYTLEKVQLKLRSARGSVTFQRNSSVVLSAGFDDRLMDALRDSLSETKVT